MEKDCHAGMGGAFLIGKTHTSVDNSAKSHTKGHVNTYPLVNLGTAAKTNMHCLGLDSAGYQAVTLLDPLQYV